MEKEKIYNLPENIKVELDEKTSKVEKKGQINAELILPIKKNLFNESNIQSSIFLEMPFQSKLGMEFVFYAKLI